MAGTAVLLAACGEKPTAPMSQFESFGGPTANAFSPSVASVTPITATVAAGGTQQFTAWNAIPAAMTAAEITWTVSGGGTIDANGLFTAGTSAGTFTVVATGTDGVFASATITVTAAAPVATGTCKPDHDKKECEKERTDKDGKDKKDKDKGKDHRNDHDGHDR